MFYVDPETYSKIVNMFRIDPRLPKNPDRLNYSVYSSEADDMTPVIREYKRVALAFDGQSFDAWIIEKPKPTPEPFEGDILKKS